MKKRDFPSVLLLIVLFIVFTAPGSVEFTSNADNIHSADQVSTGIIQSDGFWENAFPEMFSMAVTLTATKTDALFTDNNSNTEADPGDVLSYTIVIQNSGDMAEDVVFDDTIDPNTTLVGGSVSVTPIARNDGYATTGNISISVPDGGDDVLANDNDPDGGALTNVTAVQGSDSNVNNATATDQSGLDGVTGFVTMQADGSFSYEPPPGFTGTDTFTYQVTDDEGDTDTATVSIEISDMVWFVDNSSGGSNLGTFSDPFINIASFNSAQGASAPNATDGDVIFIYQGSGDYIDGINLRNSQTLLGQGIDLLTELGNLGITQSTFSDLTSSPTSGAGNRPTLTDGSGNGISLLSGNTVKGLNVGNTSGIGVTGSSVGNLTIDEMAITGSGKAFDVDGGGTLSIDLDEVTVSSSSSGGFSLQNASGSTTIANVDITTTGGTGLLAGSGGTFTVTGADNQISSNSGTAVNITNTTIGGSNVTFKNINANVSGSSSVSAIALENTGSGQFHITGTGTSGSGGTLQNISADAITLNNTGGEVTLEDMIIEDIGNMGVIDSEHDAIHGQTVNGGLTLDGMTIRRISDMAIHGAAFTNGDSNTVWNGLVITNSTFEDANRYHVAGEGDTSDEGTVRIRGLQGTVMIDGNLFKDGAEHLDLFATTGSLDLTVTSNDFFDTYKEFSSGDIASVGKMCLDLTVQGGANATVTVGDETDTSKANDFQNCRIASVRIGNDAGATGTINSTVAGNTFLVTDHSSGIGGDFDFPMGGLKYSTRGETSAVFNGRITGNSFTDVTNADGGVGNVTLDMDQGEIQVLVDGNTFHAPGNAAWFVRADATSSFNLEFDTNTYERDAFPCTTDPSCGGGYDGPGLFNRVQVQNGGVLDITLNNEDLAQHDVGFDPGNTVEVQVLDVGGGGTACAAFTDNSSPHGYALEESAGDLNLAKGVSGTAATSCSDASPGACQTVLDDNGNTGGGGNASADPPTVSVFGTVDIVSSSCSVPSGAIFSALDVATPDSEDALLLASIANHLRPTASQISQVDFALSKIDSTDPVVDDTLPHFEYERLAAKAKSNTADEPTGQFEVFQAAGTLLYLASSESLVWMSQIETTVLDLPRVESHTYLNKNKTATGLPSVAFSGENINVSLGTLDPGQEVTIEFQATIDDPLPSGVDRVQNQATVSGSNFSDVLTTDPDPNPDFPPAAGETITPLNVELDLSLTLDEGWRMLSSPIDGLTYEIMLGDLWTQGIATGADYDGGTPNVYTWPNDATGTWASLDNLSQTIPDGTGFLMYVFTDDEYGQDPAGVFPKTITLSGLTHAGDISPGMNGTTDGWTLVGNPYIAPIDFDLLTSSGLTGVAYVYDSNLTGVGDLGPTNSNDGGWRTTDGNFGDLTGGIITAGQGFLVQNDGGSGSLTFTEAAKTTGGQFYGKQKELSDFVRLEIQGESGYNAVWIRFSGEGSEEPMYGDALELQPLSQQYALLGARKADGTLLDIAHFPLPDEDLVVPLAVEATRGGSYTITATRMDLPAGTGLYLHDLETGETTAIDPSLEYSFTLRDYQKAASKEVSAVAGGPAKATINGADRFVITTSPEKPARELPEQVALGQNYPNPFNPTTVISYQLPVNNEVRLEVYDMLGRRVATLVDGQIAAGTHQVNFDASGLSSGTYLYRLQVGSTIMTKKLTVVK